jgi:hypothetical protein
LGGKEAVMDVEEDQVCTLIDLVQSLYSCTVAMKTWSHSLGLRPSSDASPAYQVFSTEEVRSGLHSASALEKVDA